MFSILLQGDNVYCKSMKYRDALPIVLWTLFAGHLMLLVFKCALKDDFHQAGLHSVEVLCNVRYLSMSV